MAGKMTIDVRAGERAVRAGKPKTDKKITGPEYRKLPIDDMVDYVLVIDHYEYAPMNKVIGKWLFNKLSTTKQTKFKYDPVGNRYRRMYE